MTYVLVDWKNACPGRGVRLTVNKRLLLLDFIIVDVNGSA